MVGLHGGRAARAAIEEFVGLSGGAAEFYCLMCLDCPRERSLPRPAAEEWHYDTWPGMSQGRLIEMG